VTRRRKTQEDWGKSIIVFYSKLTKCIGWIDKRGRRMKKTTKWWGIWFFASFYGRLFFFLLLRVLYSNPRHAITKKNARRSAFL
jgi:hypothetical protein